MIRPRDSEVLIFHRTSAETNGESCACRKLGSACRSGCWQDRRVVISCFYWLFRHLLGLVVLRCRSEAANEVEIPWGT